MTIYFLVPSRMDGPSARYVIDLSYELIGLGASPVICSYDSSKSVLTARGVIQNIELPQKDWAVKRKIFFDKLNVDENDFVVSIGSRVVTDAFALEFKKRGATYIKQFEDDEEVIFLNCNKKVGATLEQYRSQLIKGFNDYKKCRISVFSEADARFTVVDPYFKGATLCALDGYAKIWGGLKYSEEALVEKEFFILPPVASEDEVGFLRSKLDRYNVVGNKSIYFIGGTIYSKQDAEIFITAWCQFWKGHQDTMLYISKSRTAKVVIEYIENNFSRDGNGVCVVDLKSDSEYQDLLVRAAFVLSIGGGQFDIRRLPSRLVKAMSIGKIIIAPNVGFGESLSHRVNGLLCKNNTVDNWLEVLNESAGLSDIASIEKNSIGFFEEFFSIAKVASSFYDYLQNLRATRRQISHIPVDLLRDVDIDVEHCMLADVINISNSSRHYNNALGPKAIRIRFVKVGECLFIQSLNREDYNHQVSSAVNALIRARGLAAEDSGFFNIERSNLINIFGLQVDERIVMSELKFLIRLMRGKLRGVGRIQRSYVFNKLLLSFRVFKICKVLINRFCLHKVIFHADMQPVEALVSTFLNAFDYNLKTIALQHAIFYHTENFSDVNVVNIRVSPSRYSIVWDVNVGEKLATYNNKTKIIHCAGFPSAMISIPQDSVCKREALVILDGPNHDSFNRELFGILIAYFKLRDIKEVDFKAHPNYSESQVSDFASLSSFTPLAKVSCKYKMVFFVSSTLGYEMKNFCDVLYRYSPRELSSAVDIIDGDCGSAFHDLESLVRLSNGFLKVKDGFNNTVEGDFYKTFVAAIDAI